MTPSPDPVVSDEMVPACAGVVVIGGGIIGTSTAFALAEKGIDVVLCEKGEIGAEQSSRNWGWCRTQGRDPREIALSLEANRMWGGLNAKIGGETGFRQEGVLYLCNNDADVAKYEAWLDKARIYQVDARLLSSAEVDKLLPGATRKWVGGLYSPSAGRAKSRSNIRLCELTVTGCQNRSSKAGLRNFGSCGNTASTGPTAQFGFTG